MKDLKFPLITLSVILLVIITLSIFRAYKTNINTLRVDFYTTASDLNTEFTTHEIRATHKYEDKHLIVVGDITKMGIIPSGKLCIKLDDCVWVIFSKDLIGDLTLFKPTDHVEVLGSVSLYDEMVFISGLKIQTMTTETFEKLNKKGNDS